MALVLGAVTWLSAVSPSSNHFHPLPPALFPAPRGPNGPFCQIGLKYFNLKIVLLNPYRHNNVIL